MYNWLCEAESGNATMSVELKSKSRHMFALVRHAFASNPGGALKIYVLHYSYYYYYLLTQILIHDIAQSPLTSLLERLKPDMNPSTLLSRHKFARGPSPPGVA